MHVIMCSCLNVLCCHACGCVSCDVFGGDAVFIPANWSLVEMTSVKQSMKHKVSSNFQMLFLHLHQMDPLVEASCGQEWY